MCCCFFVVKNEWMNEWKYEHVNLFFCPVSYAFFVIDNDDIPDTCLGYMASWLHKMSETFPYKPVLLKKGFVY